MTLPATAEPGTARPPTTAAWGRRPQPQTPATAGWPGLGLEVGIRLPGRPGRRRAGRTSAPCTKARQRLRHACAGGGRHPPRCGGAGCRPSRRPRLWMLGPALSRLATTVARSRPRYRRRTARLAAGTFSAAAPRPAQRAGSHGPGRRVPGRGPDGRGRRGQPPTARAPRHETDGLPLGRDALDRLRPGPAAGRSRTGRVDPARLLDRRRRPRLGPPTTALKPVAGQLPATRGNRPRPGAPSPGTQVACHAARSGRTLHVRIGAPGRDQGGARPPRPDPSDMTDVRRPLSWARQRHRPEPGCCDRSNQGRPRGPRPSSVVAVDALASGVGARLRPRPWPDRRPTGLLADDHRRGRTPDRPGSATGPAGALPRASTARPGPTSPG